MGSMHAATLEDLKFELFLRKRNSLTWTTRNGNVIPISRLTTKHIDNIVQFLMQFENETSVEDKCESSQYFDERTDQLF